MLLRLEGYAQHPATLNEQGIGAILMLLESSVTEILVFYKTGLFPYSFPPLEDPPSVFSYNLFNRDLITLKAFIDL
jgi:hypothetical protein